MLATLRSPLSRCASIKMRMARSICRRALDRLLELADLGVAAAADNPTTDARQHEVCSSTPVKAIRLRDDAVRLRIEGSIFNAVEFS